MNYIGLSINFYFAILWLTSVSEKVIKLYKVEMINGKRVIYRNKPSKGDTL